VSVAGRRLQGARHDPGSFRRGPPPAGRAVAGGRGLSATASHQVYFALRPDPAAAAEAIALAERLRAKHGLTGRPLAPERLHVSLNWIGHAPAGQAVVKACEMVSSLPLPSFRIAFNRVGSFGGRAGQRPLVLFGQDGVIGVRRLYEALHLALMRPGVVRGPPQAFEPHMTLLWEPHEIEEEFVEPIGWPVRELVLVDSVVGRQNVLGRWPLP
jgi:2'-5' RNA ligase